jgi:rfaE bifunctional protein kinase chain/domain
MSVRYEDKEDFIGGAGIVAQHFRAAGAEVTFSTVLGKDPLGDYVIEGLEKEGINLSHIIDETRPTTNKNAFVTGGYRLLKVDTLDNRPISEKIIQTLTDQITKTDADIVVFSDFRHGMFNKQSIDTLIKAIPEKAFRVADSQVASRWGNILEFKGFDLITPNEREARFALGDQDSVVRPLATQLFEGAQCKTLMLKLGERGMLTYRTRPEGDPRTIISVDSFAEKVVDAVGAGDALLAYAALSMVASKGNEAAASIIGNMAAGLECEFDGNQVVTPELVLKTLERIEAHANFA